MRVACSSRVSFPSRTHLAVSKVTMQRIQTVLNVKCNTQRSPQCPSVPTHRGQPLGRVPGVPRCRIPERAVLWVLSGSGLCELSTKEGDVCLENVGQSVVFEHDVHVEVCCQCRPICWWGVCTAIL